MVTSRSVAVLAFTAILAASCDWISSDIFPSWLPYVEARADLTAAATAAGIGTLRTLDTVEYVNFTDTAGADKSKILAYLRGLDGETLVAFEPTGMKVEPPWVKAPEPGTPLFALGPRIIQTPEGFIAGQLAFNMDDLTTDPVSWGGGISLDGIVLAMGSPVKYYVLRAEYDELVMANQLKIQMFNETFTTVTDTFRPLALTDTNNFLIDAQYYGNADLSVGVFRILVRTDAGAQAFSFISDGATVLASYAPVITGPLPMSDSRAWLTADGVVTINHDKNNYLARYAYDWPGNDAPPTDQLQLTGDTEAYQIMSFDASGTWWYLYDRLAQQLYELRTWW